MYNEAIKILKKIKDLGYDAYIIGGYSRDKYLKKENKDIDISTNIKIDLLKSNFNIIKENNKYGSFVIKESNYQFEITLFRKDIYENSRYPKIEYVATLEEDIKRRDFTVNTLCIDYNENYIDLINSKNDIDNKIIRTIGKSDIKLKEDPLRILRAIRFACDLDFIIDEELKKSIIKNKQLLKNLTTSKTKKELNKIINKNKANNLMKELEITDYLS